MKKFSFDPLPKGLVTNKPLDQEAYDESIIYELEQQDRLMISRKRDGWKLYIVFYKGNIKMYTAGLNRVDDKFPHLKEELNKLNLPSKTSLVGECHIEKNGIDDLGLIQSIFKSSTKKALAIQEQFGKVKLMLFGVLFYNDKNYNEAEYTYQYDTVKAILARAIGKLKYIFPIEMLNVSYDEAKRMVEEKNWEGLVLYDKTYQFNFEVKANKSPKRPKGCYKWKPSAEGDFIVREKIYSKDKTGKTLDRLKEIVLLQIDPATGKEFNCGKFGLFTNKVREELKTIALPIVVQIKYGRRFPSGKLREAKEFIRIRTDKKLEECFAPKSYATNAKTNENN